MNKQKVKSGVYVIRCDCDSIKIGMSDNIERRLKQYTGYQGSAKPVERLMLVFTPDYKDFEKVSHRFASDFGLPRHMPYEVFDCSTDQQTEFLEAFKLHLLQRYEHRISEIQTAFNITKAAPVAKPLPLSNIRIAKEDSLLAPITTGFDTLLNQFKYKDKRRSEREKQMIVDC